MRPLLIAAAVIGAASALAITEAMAQCPPTSIPLPDATLLAPPPEFSCEFKPASAGEAQPGAPRDADAEAAALNAKLDYERQCYRHGRTIVHGRLRQLQASVAETVKAVNRACPAAVSTTRPGSRPSIPLPRRALLTPVAEFDCTFKDSSDGPSNPAQAAAAVRIKIDYERQCYRQNQIILGSRLEQLRASVGETIKAIDGNERSAARGKPAAKQQTVTRQPTPSATEPPRATEEPAATQPAEQRTNGRRVSRSQEAPCAVFSHGRCVGRDPDPRVRFMLSHDGRE